MPLDEVTHESGAIEYVRGSHKWGVFSNPEYETDETLFPGYGGEQQDPNRTPDVHKPLPDIENERDKFDIAQFDTGPGDVIANHLRSIHYAPGNFTDRRRRAIGHRWAGGDATYALRTHASRLLPPRDPQLKNGEPFPEGDHHLYPQVWPRRRLRQTPRRGIARLSPFPNKKPARRAPFGASRRAGLFETVKVWVFTRRRCGRRSGLRGKCPSHQIPKPRSQALSTLPGYYCP